MFHLISKNIKIECKIKRPESMKFIPLLLNVNYWGNNNIIIIDIFNITYIFICFESSIKIKIELTFVVELGTQFHKMDFDEEHLAWFRDTWTLFTHYNSVSGIPKLSSSIRCIIISNPPFHTLTSTKRLLQ